MEDSPDVIATEFAESLETMDSEEKRESLQFFVDSLGLEERTILEDVVQDVI